MFFDSTMNGPSQRPSTLEQWLAYQEHLHPHTIDMGLDRVREVAARMGLTRPASFVYVIAGTNGKGSTVAFIEAIFRAAGYSVGAYTSPHIRRYNERIRINGDEVKDEALCQSFERIENARAEVSLTYFEFGTLAALDLMERAVLDIAVLEVGMGGRLDAVNIVDGDVAVVTNIGLDHMQFLGANREAIGAEKAGIYRPGRPAVCADRSPPASLARPPNELLYQLGRDFDFAVENGTWRWRSALGERYTLPVPHMRGRYQLTNAATALMAVMLAQNALPVSQAHLRRGLREAFVPGRFEICPTVPPTILDVAHNPDGARVLAETLRAQPCLGRTYGIFGVMADKDIAAMVESLRGVIDEWHVCNLAVDRAASAREVARRIGDLLPDAHIKCHASVAEADSSIRAVASPSDRIVVFGSFFTVSAWCDSGIMVPNRS